jgi:endonuclease III
MGSLDKTEQIDNIFIILSKSTPSPKTELYFTNEFTLLVAIILSAQSTDVGVNRVTEKLFLLVKKPEDVINLGIEKLKSNIKTLGLYNNKAKNIFELSKILLNHSIPDSVEELEKLPGVGSKTARVFLNCARSVPVIAVDTHVFRVSNRLGIIKEKTPVSAEKKLNIIIPSKWKLHAHHWLILHGRYICKARKPSCDICIIRQYCDFYNNNI